MTYGKEMCLFEPKQLACLGLIVSCPSRQEWRGERKTCGQVGPFPVAAESHILLEPLLIIEMLAQTNLYTLSNCFNNDRVAY